MSKLPDRKPNTPLQRRKAAAAIIADYLRWKAQKQAEKSTQQKDQQVSIS